MNSYHINDDDDDDDRQYWDDEDDDVSNDDFPTPDINKVTEIADKFSSTPPEKQLQLLHELLNKSKHKPEILAAAYWYSKIKINELVKLSDRTPWDNQQTWLMEVALRAAPTVTKSCKCGVVNIEQPYSRTAFNKLLKRKYTCVDCLPPNALQLILRPDLAPELEAATSKLINETHKYFSMLMGYEIPIENVSKFLEKWGMLPEIIDDEIYHNDYLLVWSTPQCWIREIPNNEYLSKGINNQ